MNIPLLGRLDAEPDSPEWLKSQPRPVPFFDGQKLEFVLDSLEESDKEDVNDAIASFLKLDPSDRLAASQYVFANYVKMAARDPDLDCRIESEDAVWDHVQPTAVCVSRRDRRDCAIYVAISANCDWDQEHGLQIVFRRGSELARVSDYDGHLTHTDAYDLPEDQDRIVS